MSRKYPQIETVTLQKIVGGGQTIGTLPNGQRIFVWGGLPEEIVEIQISKNKSKYAEGVATKVIKPSSDRVEPLDPDSYLSTSPWQITKYDVELHYKATLIQEAFELHGVVLPNPIEVTSDGREYGYRNKVEFSWWWNKESEQLDLAFFKRGSHNKTPIEKTSLATNYINQAAISIRNLLRSKNVQAMMLKTLLVRCDQHGSVVAQLYVKDREYCPISSDDFQSLHIKGLEIVFSNPKSPASVVTQRLMTFGDTSLSDKILGVNFNYSVEGFFQVNIPVYEQSLIEIKKWIDHTKPLVDLYSGVGTIGLTSGCEKIFLVESNETAVEEMKRNIISLGLENSAHAILATSEKSLDYITRDINLIVDPPRAGLHQDVIQKILDSEPKRVIYLSCNPITQARDIAQLSEKYKIKHHIGYNFFPKTPHIENLTVIDLKT